MNRHHGGIPLEKLTSHARGHATNSAPVHQGSKEMQRRAKRLAKLSGAS